MRWVVRIVGGLAAFVLLVVVLIAALPWYDVATEKATSGPFRAYLEAHETVLDPDAADLGLVLAENDYEARYIILSEMHGYALPQRFDAGLMQHLQERGPARWYLAEMTPREAIAANHYLDTGDDTYLRAVFDRFAAMEAQWGNREFFEKFERFRAMQQAWPEDRSFRLIGIDKARPDEDALPMPNRGDGPAADLGSFRSADAINRSLMDLTHAEDAGRYAVMKANMRALAAMPGFEEARFAGLWGLFHGSETPINGVTPLSMWLQDDAEPYAGEVLTISTLCFGQCFNMMPASALPSQLQGPEGQAYVWLPMEVENPYAQRVRGAGEIMATLGEERAALYPIGLVGSPYQEGRRLTGTSGYLTYVFRWEAAGSGADAMDYLLAYRGSPGLTPWQGEAYDITGDAGSAPIIFGSDRHR
ncbi:hypothetical protein [Parvularcula maris]|uniref:Uncharacterized protein n=1 Tax=Parvularcula maris TaxID=2965077 RepID=A0A9X2L7N8_9PROT|nr:hypothetical protein [Parvularcula maris]MCQ8184557.1 hypothetical protein [Parvularcula maris]